MLLILGRSGTQSVAMVTILLAPLVEPYCKKSNISVTNWLRYVNRFFIISDQNLVDYMTSSLG